MQHITYKFTIMCQEPGHILLGMTTTAPMTLCPDLQAWSDCLRCFTQTGWKKTANILKSMTCTASTPGSFVITGPLDKRKKIFSSLAPRWSPAHGQPFYVSVRFTRLVPTSEVTVHYWSGHCVGRRRVH